MIKICDLALFSPDTSSGVRTYISSKIHYIAQRRDSIQHIVIVPGEYDLVSTTESTKVIVVRGLPTFYPGLSLAINLGKIADIVEREAPDLIELNCQYSLPWAAFLATRHRRTPIVGVYHTDVASCVRHMASNTGPAISSLIERITEFYEGLIYKHCTATIILNSSMKPRLVRIGAKRVHHLPCGVDLTTFNPSRADPFFRQRLGIAAQTILLYVGRLSIEKEIEILLDAYRQLPRERFTLLIAGDGPQADFIRGYSASHHGVKYLGHFAQPLELASIYASSDILVSPSRYETFGMATLEGIASGMGIVGIKDSGTAPLVPPEIGMLSLAGNAFDMAEKIAAVAEWPRDRVRNSSHLFASENYSWESVLDGYFRIYRELIEEHREKRVS